jgi:hypothetical protein
VKALLMSMAVLAALLFPPASHALADGCSVSPGVVQTTDTVTGTGGDDVIDCSSAGHGHTIIGNAGDDTITGSSSADVIVPGDGVDTVAGGGGVDVVSFSDAGGPVTANTAGASNDGFGNDESSHYTGIENLSGSAYGDRLTGDGAANSLRGMGGNDILAGRGGSDVMDGGTGVDAAVFSGATTGVTANLATGTATGQGSDRLISIANLSGTPYHDVLRGYDGANRLSGGGGTDVLLGGKGNDRLLGGDGNDTLFGGPGADALDAGSATDACLEGTGAGTKAACEARAFGDAYGIPLFQPSWNVIGVGFHESLLSTSVGLHPDGHLLLNDNPTKFTAPAEQTDGLSYVVMASRGRPTSATSAADFVVGSSTPIYAPVTGTVILVRQYLLYCQALDWQVVIRPDGRSDLIVMVLHMVDIRVSKGNRVKASVTGIGTSRVNDSAGAQENDYFPDQYPHVHVEMEKSTTILVPGCLL